MHSEAEFCGHTYTKKSFNCKISATNIEDLLVSGPFYNFFFSAGETHLNLPPNQRGPTGFQSNMMTNEGSWFDLEPSSCDEKVPKGSPRFLPLNLRFSVPKQSEGTSHSFSHTHNTNILLSYCIGGSISPIEHLPNADAILLHPEQVDEDLSEPILALCQRPRISAHPWLNTPK